jgi:hypothetical protein
VKKKQILIMAATAVVLVAVLAVGFSLVRSVKPDSFLSGNAKGNGEAFFAPTTISTDSRSTNSIKYMIEKYPGTKNTETTIAATSSSIADTADTLPQLKKTINSHTGAEYVKLISTQGTFIKILSASGPAGIDTSDANNGELTLHQAVVFSNKYIKSNAWRFDYTIARKTPTGKTTKIDGVLIYAIGKKASYRFLVSSADDNWNANQSTWRKIINSLQIDR